MFSFLKNLKKKKGIMKLATVISKYSKTTISSYSGNRNSIERYFIKVMHHNGTVEEYGVSAHTYRRAQKGIRIHLHFEDAILNEIVLGA